MKPYPEVESKASWGRTCVQYIGQIDTTVDSTMVHTRLLIFWQIKLTGASILTGQPLCLSLAWGLYPGPQSWERSISAVLLPPPPPPPPQKNKQKNKTTPTKKRYFKALPTNTVMKALLKPMSHIQDFTVTLQTKNLRMVTRRDLSPLSMVPSCWCDLD